MEYRYYGIVTCKRTYSLDICQICNKTIRHLDRYHYIGPSYTTQYICLCVQCFPSDSFIYDADDTIMLAINVYNNVFSDTHDLVDFLKLVKVGQIEVQV